MKNENYNPLNEGYSGKETLKKGYTGGDNSSSGAPATVTNVQSGVVKKQASETPKVNTSDTE